MDQAAKQQVVEQIKQAENILVTVSTNPSVDQLAACIGMALMVNKLQKHATALFSGTVPSTIQFLQPEKTLEKSTDSLRDFIISLDKAKADKLRYKVEDKVVRIYITPYRTSLSEKDIQFSQGDYNVDLVLALGVKDRTQLDSAITSHGKILHDASVVSVNAGEGKVLDLGQLNWHDQTASSLCEMLVSISEALGSNLIDNQIATAFLTGIVAETERFSNTKTSPKVMTMSAQLMAAGANQQLIATQLNPPQAPPAAGRAVKPKPSGGPKPSGPPASGLLSVEHGPEEKAAPQEEEVRIDPSEIRIDEEGNIESAQDIYRKNHPTPKNAASPNLPSMLARSTDGQAGAAIPPPSQQPFHSMVDSSYTESNTASPFSTQANMGQEWYDPMTADQGPMSNEGPKTDEGIISKAPTVAPITPDMMFKEGDGAAPTAAAPAASPPPPPPDAPAPPPVPPPIPLSPASPTAAPSGAKASNLAKEKPDPTSPNTAWPV